MARHGSFLQRSRHDTVYYFRRRIPVAIRSLCGRSFIYRSLGTSDKSAALVHARALAAVTDRIFANLVHMTKKKDAALRSDYELEIELDGVLGKASKLRVSADPTKPGDHEGAKDALTAAISALSGSLEGAVPKAVEASPADEQSVGSQLGEAIDHYLTQAEGLKPTTRKTYTTALRNIVLPFFEADALLESIGQREFAQFVDHVNAMERAPSTKEGYVVAFSSLGKWYRNRGREVPVWTAGGLLNAKRLPPDKARDTYTFEEVGVLFRNAAQYRTTEPAKFWVTVMCAFFGCRVEELAQVDLTTDLRFDEKANVYYLKLDELSDESTGAFAPDKSLKARASWRVIPIHSALVELGAITYLNSQVSEGFERPFESCWEPHESNSSDGGTPVRATKWSHKISKWGGKELRDLVAAGQLTKGKKTYFHSLRHTFVTHLASLGITQETRALLTGHESPGEDNTTYNKLRNDAAYLSRIVEGNLGAYVDALNNALGAPA